MTSAMMHIGNCTIASAIIQIQLLCLIVLCAAENTGQKFSGSGRTSNLIEYLIFLFFCQLDDYKTKDARLLSLQLTRRQFTKNSFD